MEELAKGCDANCPYSQTYTQNFSSFFQPQEQGPEKGAWQFPEPIPVTAESA